MVQFNFNTLMEFMDELGYDPQTGRTLSADEYLRKARQQYMREFEEKERERIARERERKLAEARRRREEEERRRRQEEYERQALEFRQRALSQLAEQDIGTQGYETYSGVPKRETSTGKLPTVPENFNPYLRTYHQGQGQTLDQIDFTGNIKRFAKRFSEELTNGINELKSLGKKDKEIKQALIPQDDTVLQRLREIEKSISDVGKVEGPIDLLKQGWYSIEIQNMLSQESVKQINGLPNYVDEIEDFIQRHSYMFEAQDDNVLKRWVKSGIRGAGYLVRQQLDSLNAAAKDPLTWIVAGGLFVLMVAATGGIGAIATAGSSSLVSAAGSSLMLSPLITSGTLTKAVASLKPLAAIKFGVDMGTFRYMAQLEETNSYVDLVSSGVDKNLARDIASTVGAVNGIIEMLQLDQAFSMIPGVTDLAANAKKLAKDELLKKAMQTLKEYGVNVTSEALEEALQAGTSELGMALGQYLQNAPNPSTLEGINALAKTMSEKRFWDTLIDEGISALQTMWLTPILSSGAQLTVQEIANSIDNKIIAKKIEELSNMEETERAKAFKDSLEYITGNEQYEGVTDKLLKHFNETKDSRTYVTLLAEQQVLQDLLQREEVSNRDKEVIQENLNKIKNVTAKVMYETKSQNPNIEYRPTNEMEIEEEILNGDFLTVNEIFNSMTNEYSIEQYKLAHKYGVLETIKAELAKGTNKAEIMNMISKDLPRKLRKNPIDTLAMINAVETIQSEIKAQIIMNALYNMEQVQDNTDARTVVEGTQPAETTAQTQQQETQEQTEAPESPTTDETEPTRPTGQVEEENATEAVLDAIETTSEQTQPDTTETTQDTQETEVTFEPSDVVRVKVSNILLDPKRFQFRYDGTTDKLAGAKWDDMLAGIVILWRDEHGDLYAINGHHRVSKAKQEGVDSIRAIIISSENYTEQEARALGALVNIAEGSATPIDVAKVLREGTITLDELTQYVSPKSKIARDGIALSKLNDWIFTEVATRQFPLERAVIIGEYLGNNPEAQNQVVKELEKLEKRKRITNDVLRELIAAAKGMATEEYTEITLFGEEVFTRNFALERAELVAYVKGQLRERKNILKNITKEKNAIMLEELGNKIAIDENVKEMSAAEQALWIIDQTLIYEGTTLNKLFNELAKKYAHAKNATERNNIKKYALNELLRLVESGELINEKIRQKFQRQSAKDILSDTTAVTERRRITTPLRAKEISKEHIEGIKVKSKRIKGENESFVVSIRDGKVELTTYRKNKKIATEELTIDFINKYLNESTEYGRLQAIYNEDINKLKTDELEHDIPPHVIDNNKEAINKALKEALELAGIIQTTDTGDIRVIANIPAQELQQINTFGEEIINKLREQPQVKIVANDDVKESQAYKSTIKIAQALQNNVLFNGLTIEYSGQSGKVQFSREELDRYGYNHQEEGEKYIYGAYDARSRTITLNSEATRDTILEEAIHDLQARLEEIDPELQVLVDEWEQEVRERAAQEGIIIPEGYELLAQALVYTEFGYASTNPYIANLIAVDDEIVNKFKIMLGEEVQREGFGFIEPEVEKEKRILRVQYEDYASSKLKESTITEKLNQAKAKRRAEIARDLSDGKTVVYYHPSNGQYAIVNKAENVYKLAYISPQYGLLQQNEFNTADEVAKKLIDTQMYYKVNEIHYQLKNEYDRTVADNLYKKLLQNEAIQLTGWDVGDIINAIESGNLNSYDYQELLENNPTLSAEGKRSLKSMIDEAIKKGLHKPNNEVTLKEFVYRFYGIEIADDNEISPNEIKNKTERQRILEQYQYFKKNVTISRPNNTIQYQIKPMQETIESEEFKRWFGNSKVVDEEGRPLVVYHGTTHEWEVYSTELGNIENDLGIGFYATSDYSDAQMNYLREGADLTARIEKRIEEISELASYDQIAYADLLEEVLGIDTLSDDFDYDEYVTEEYFRQIAEAELMGDTEKVMEVYLSIQNPFVLDKFGGTYIQYELPDYVQKRIAEIEEQLQYEEDDDVVMQLEEELDDLMYNTEYEGTAQELYDAIMKVAYEYDVDGLEIWESLNAQIDFFSGVTAFDLVRTMKSIDQIAYMEDYERGGLAGNQFIQDVIKAMGYDGIIYENAKDHFPNMIYLPDGTKHYIAFYPTQIKSVDNVGTFNAHNPNIYYQLKSTTNNEVKIIEKSIRPAKNKQYTIDGLENYKELLFVLLDNNIAANIKISDRYDINSNKVLSIGEIQSDNLWHELVAKEIIRYATINGYDYVALADNKQIEFFNQYAKKIISEITTIAISQGEEENVITQQAIPITQQMAEEMMKESRALFQLEPNSNLSEYESTKVGLNILRLAVKANGFTKNVLNKDGNGGQGDVKLFFRNKFYDNHGDKIPLSELKAAIIPDYADSQMVAALRDAGVFVELYGENDDIKEVERILIREDEKEYKDAWEATSPDKYYQIKETDPDINERSWGQTVKEANITNEELKKALTDRRFFYEVRHNKDTILDAALLIDRKGVEWVEARILSDLDLGATLFAASQILTYMFMNAGEIERAVNLIEKTAEKATKAGQAIQILSWWGRMTPEGMVRYAARKMSDLMSEQEKSKVRKTTAELVDEFNKINERFLNEIDMVDLFKRLKDLTPEEILARRIASAVSSRQLSEPMQMMIDTLYEKAQEKLLPATEMPQNPLTLIVDAIINREKYREVWAEAKKLVEQEYAGNQQILDLLEPYFNADIVQTFAESQIAKAVDEELQELGIKVKEIVRDHYLKTDEATKTLTAKLVEKAGLTGIEAEILEAFIKREMKKRTEQAKREVINNVIKQRQPYERRGIDEIIIELSNAGALLDDDLRPLIAEKLGLPVFSKDLAEYIYNQSQYIQTLPEGRERDVATAKMLKAIADNIPTSIWEKVATIQTMMHLLNLRTFLRNLIGNTMFGILDTVAMNYLAAPIDRILSIKTGRRTTIKRNLFKLISTQWQGYKQGMKLGIEDALMGIDTFQEETKYELRKTRTFKGGILGALETALDISLRATDRASFTAAYFDSLDEQMRIAGVTKPTPEMVDRAIALGLYRTFNDMTKLAEASYSIKRALNKVSSIVTQTEQFGLGDLVLKYPRTPANIMARAIDYSPIGVITTMLKIMADKDSDGYLKQRMVVQSLARGIAGTSIIALGMVLAKIGVITGNDSDDDDDIYALRKQYGLSDYSINLSALRRHLINKFQDPTAGELRYGDEIVSYDWAEPIAISLAIGADTVLGKGDTLSLFGTIMSAVEAGGQALTNQPLLLGITRLFRHGDLMEGISNVIQNIPSSFTPAILSQIAYALDPTIRDPYTLYPESEAVWNAVINKIPILREKLPAKYTALGDVQKIYDEENASLIERVFRTMISPANISEYQPTRELQLMIDLYERTGMTEHIPKRMQREFTFDGVKYQLTPQEYEELSRWFGREIRNRINYALGMYMYGWSDEEKVEEIQYIINEVRKELRDKVRQIKNIPLEEEDY